MDAYAPLLPSSTSTSSDPITVKSEPTASSSKTASNPLPLAISPYEEEDEEEAEDEAMPPEVHVDAAYDDHEEGEGEVDAASGEVVLTADELRDKIVKQVEYYFSDDNLPTDTHLLKFVKTNKQGFVPIFVVASFRRMKKLVQDLSVIEAALRTSSKLVVSSNGKRVRRLNPLPIHEVKDTKKRTVIVENLPVDFSKERAQIIFGDIGKIVHITIHDPNSVGGSEAIKMTELVLSSKVHALVEYESMEAAEKAVATLNDQKNWRSGMRVELLSKRTVVGSGKHRHSFKAEHEATAKGNHDTNSREGGPEGEKIYPVGHNVKDEEYRTNATGRRRNRNKGQGKGYIQQNPSGQVLATSGCEFTSKPIPGPRMPDGTRGFAMGRGKPMS